jgi:DNA or RNA helicases of superfamily II
VGLIKLRDYQEECKNAFFKALKNGRKRHLIILPTGAGKTILFSSIAKEMNTQTLIMAHRDELIQQSVAKMKMIWPEVDVGVVKGTKQDTNHQYLVGSTQTLANEKRRRDLPPIKFCILDEAHHGLAPTNQAIFRDIMGPETILLGVTATPNRTDGLGLGRVFADDPSDGPDYERSILEMISEGYLSPVRGIKGNLQVELDRVAKNRGDYDLSSLSRVMNTPQVNEAAVQLWEKYAKDRKTIIFAVDVKHTEALTKLFNHHGYKADYIHGGLNEKKRHQVLDDFSENRTQILINCNVLTEGYDEPSVDCVYLVRPTTSNGLYSQMIGRGLRLFPGKNDCLIIDGVRNSKRHNLVSITDLFPKAKKKRQNVIDNDKQEKDQDLEEDQEDSQLEEITIGRAWFEAAESQIYRSEYNWQLALEGGFKLSLIGGYIHLRKMPNGWAPYFISKNGSEVLLYNEPLNVDYAMGIAEEKIKELNLDRFAQKDAEWRKQKASPEQIDALKKWGVIPDHSLSKGEASKILDQLIEEKQLRLKKKGDRR